MPTVITPNGECQLEPVHCEVTGKWIGWMSCLSEEARLMGCTPAYVSFEVVDENGNQLVDVDIDTF